MGVIKRKGVEGDEIEAPVMPKVEQAIERPAPERAPPRNVPIESGRGGCYRIDEKGNRVPVKE